MKTAPTLYSVVFVATVLFVTGSLGGIDADNVSSLRSHGYSRLPSSDAVTDLIARVLGQQDDFVVQVSPSADGLDSYTLYPGDDKKIHIEATSGVAAAGALKHYMDTVLHVQMTWSGDSLNIPQGPLPLPSGKISAQTPYKYRYYQNVCTVSYSMAWWDWNRWEREIDFMALQGINLPLAFTGQEYVWVEVYKRLGLSEEEANEFVSGPAFYAWNRMGNMQGWAGLSEAREFNEAQKDLQIKILERMRSLGIIPVLPAFAGHVPRAMKTHYPTANITMSPNWGNFPPKYGGVYLLEPTDPLFLKIGTTFMDVQTQVYGTDHFYNADTFNEMTPASSDTGYLHAAGAAVYNSMKSYDASAIWVMQGWLFVSDPNFWQPPQMKALLDAVPNDNMLILDLTSDVIPVWSRTESYYGKPFIWNMLHNYGGNVGFYGKIPTLNEDVPASMTKATSMVGIGLTPEGINQNFMVYEFMMSNTWRSSSVDLDDWTNDYVKRRYNSASPPAGAVLAYNKLLHSVWACNNTQMGVTKAYYEKRPALEMDNPGFMPTRLFYDPLDVVAAWEGIMKPDVIATASKLDTAKFDIVDITRQVLSDYFIVLHKRLVAAYNSKNSSQVASAGAAIVSLLKDLDRILATNEHFLLGSWIQDAKAWAKFMSDKETGSFEMEFNARNQVTMWGPTGEISDYASKQWAGLVSQYYLPRWQIFIDDLQFSVDSGTDFNNDWFSNHAYRFEILWNNGPALDVSSQVTGDTVEVASALYKKYHDDIQKGWSTLSY